MINISHDLNQPLNVIKMVSQMRLRDIKNNKIDIERIEYSFQEIIKQITKMSELTDHLRKSATCLETSFGYSNKTK
ncbi:MAG: hypothetical protein HQK78_17725 [Desulfobacterales bacterium]|nr:hypothetical protein [Desulfobacterales bacterium]